MTSCRARRRIHRCPCCPRAIAPSDALTRALRDFIGSSNNDPPRKGDRDGDNLFCDNDVGYLARIDGTDALLEVVSGVIDFSFVFRVVPWRDGHGSKACTVAADVGSTFSVANVFVPADGPVTEAALTAVAAQVVERRAAVTNPDSFSFGPAIPDRETARGLEPYYVTLHGMDTYPLVLDGQAYLMFLGHAAIGWRDYPNSILILYTLKDGELAPVGSAIVKQRRGALKSVRVTESR